MRILLIIGLIALTGCASGGYNESCGQIVANGSYATATGSGSGYHCHAGYVGFGKPDYTAITALSTNYANNVNKVTTTVPITVAVVASQK